MFEDNILELPTGVDKVKLTENATKETEDESNKSDKKAFRAMRKLESWLNPEANKVVEDYSHGREMTLNQVNLALFSTVTVKEPTTYEESINSEQKENQINWKNAINKDLKEMEKRGVWEIIDEKNILINRRCIKNKWIFKVKRNGIFRARLLACGYSQVPGIDFSESFAPVLNDGSFRIMLIAKLVWDMTSTVVVIETLFLHGDLDGEIYMEVPKGLEIKHNKKLMLKKTIYGLVQSARKFYEKLINVLKVIGFYGSKSDPCLWTMWDEKVNHMIIIGIYVDDCLIIGKDKNIDCLIDELKNYEFNLKIEKNVNEYLSCCIEESKYEAKLTMIQPHLLTLLIKNFGEEIEGKRKFLTPGTPRFKIQRSTINMDFLDIQSQRKYRSEVGMEFYLKKYS
jgi:hypothetical protein